MFVSVSEHHKFHCDKALGSRKGECFANYYTREFAERCLIVMIFPSQVVLDRGHAVDVGRSVPGDDDEAGIVRDTESPRRTVITEAVRRTCHGTQRIPSSTSSHICTVSREFLPLHPLISVQ